MKMQIAMFKVPVQHAGEVTFKVLVKVIGKRRAYGRDEYLVEPVAGEGKAWASSRNVDIAEKGE